MRNGTLPKDTDPLQAARDAGLHYVTDGTPGISRLRKGKKFEYVDQHGKKIRDASVIDRIDRIVIPPAWTDVWICPSPLGHIQATGHDERGRKQYRYHQKWQLLRNATKFDKIVSFGFVLPKIREHIHHDLHGDRLTHVRLLAAIVHLLDLTHMRIGNEEYAKENKSYGLTTLQERHAKTYGSDIHFRFRGKSGVLQNIDVRDKGLARLIRNCKETHGHELFHYKDASGTWRAVLSEDVNAYIHAIAEEPFTAKDFRTWGGTVSAATSLHVLGDARGAHAAKQCIVDAIKAAAHSLGNEPATCKKYYVDPRIIDAYLEHELCRTLDRFLEAKNPRTHHDLHPLEKGVHHILKKKQ